MTSFDEVAAELGSLRMLIQMVPEENSLDIMSLKMRMQTVLQKAVLRAALRTALVVQTPPPGYSDESSPNGLWWTMDAEACVEEIVRLVHLAQDNQVAL